MVGEGEGREHEEDEDGAETRGFAHGRGSRRRPRALVCSRARCYNGGRR